MSVSLTRFSWWLWGGKEKEPVSRGSPLKERESLKFPLEGGTEINPPSHRKVRRRKWQSREERMRLDIEYDVVLVPSDGDGSLSGYESDDSDWSIGWLEPHGSDFQSDDDDSENSFAVLVPCYTPGCKEVESSNNEVLNVIKNLPNEFSAACSNNYMEQWLASLQNFEA